ncbi:MAG: hypothetical protein SGI92_04080 [Bryobacteraceae bacterium]|nr:hypothetical protein [Bryobacteraceae bacterium]
MKVTREVILDLFPVYLSGEASPDTKTLVETYLAQDGELAAQLRSQWSEAAASIPLPADLEMRSLRRTRIVVNVRSGLMALAIWCTLLPFAFRVGKNGFHFLLFEYQPAYAVANLCVGIAGWIAWYILGRRLKLT